MIAALFFALHPLRVEAVAWTSAREHLLSSFFFLAALYGYLRAVDGAANHRLDRRWITWTVVAHLMGILSGGNGLGLPIVLILLDIYPLKRLELVSGVWSWPRVGERLLEKLPLVALSLGGIFVARGLLDPIMAVSTDVVAGDWLEWLAGILCQPGFYLWKTVFPQALLPVL